MATSNEKEKKPARINRNHFAFNLCRNVLISNQPKGERIAERTRNVEDHTSKLNEKLPHVNESEKCNSATVSKSIELSYIKCKANNNKKNSADSQISSKPRQSNECSSTYQLHKRTVQDNSKKNIYSNSDSCHRTSGYNKTRCGYSGTNDQEKKNTDGFKGLNNSKSTYSIGTPVALSKVELRRHSSSSFDKKYDLFNHISNQENFNHSPNTSYGKSENQLIKSEGSIIPSAFICESSVSKDFTPNKIGEKFESLCSGDEFAEPSTLAELTNDLSVTGKCIKIIENEDTLTITFQNPDYQHNMQDPFASYIGNHCNSTQTSLDEDWLKPDCNESISPPILPPHSLENIVKNDPSAHTSECIPAVESVRNYSPSQTNGDILADESVKNGSPSQTSEDISADESVKIFSSSQASGDISAGELVRIGSPAHTSGYISASELETLDEETASVSNTPRKTDNLNFVPELEQFEEISEFLDSNETAHYKSPQRAKQVLTDINNLIRYYFNGNKVILYGSYSSNLAMNTSNINLALVTNQAPNDSLMMHIRRSLHENLPEYYVETFEPASNPRRSKIFLSTKEDDISCELVYCGKTVDNYLKMNKLLKSICKYDNRVKTLIFATRIWAEDYVIHDAENGKLHIMGFSLMIIYFLQRLEKPILPIIDVTSEERDDEEMWVEKQLPRMEQYNSASVGELWLEFLKFYSQTFDWSKDVVCITTENKVSKKEKNWEKFWIAIEDPYLQKNIASSVIKPELSDYIQECFKSTYVTFLNPSDTDSDSTDSNSTDDKGIKSSKGKYSFRPSRVALPDLPVCETCEEIGGPCENCYSIAPFSKEPLPEISPESLEFVEQVLDDVYEKNLLSDKKINGRIGFIRDLEQFVQIRFRDANLSLFGSSVNGFGFESSDLDICMTFCHKAIVSREQNTKRNDGIVLILKNLCGHLRRDRYDRYQDVFGIYNAETPLLKFSSSSMHWDCDLSLSNVLPVHNSKLLNTYASFDERCRKLGCALKLLAKKAGIASCVTKSLSSYSYIIMTIHYLQQIEPPVLPVFQIHHREVFENQLVIPQEMIKNNYWLCEDISTLRERYGSTCTNKTSVAELWVGLLDFYLDYDLEQAITITQKEPLSASELSKISALYNIQDPFLPKKNLGSITSSKKATEILKIFQQARLLFRRNKPKSVTDLKGHYFSTKNLTGRYNEDMDCALCGVYGHNENNCKKSRIQRRKNYNHNSFKQKI